MNEKIKALLELKPDWNSYGAEPPNQVAATMADDALGIIARMGLPEPYILPSAENGIGLGWHNVSGSGDIEFFNDGDVCAVVSDKVSMPDAWEVEPNNAAELEKSFRKIADFLNLTL